jgi:hypothetical protein
VADSALRIYDPAECSDDGKPLDWDRCRPCHGDGGHTVEPDGSLGGRGMRSTPCELCAGHGSLKVAAFAELLAPGVWRVGRKVPVNVYFADRIVTHTATPTDAVRLVERLNALTEPRCEDCGHPMGDGTWEDPPLAELLGYVETRERGRRAIMVGREPLATAGHSDQFTPCDEGCRHGGEHGTVRISNPTESAGYTACGVVGSWLTSQRVDPAWTSVSVEASWRPVDIRTLGWPHDLRPERLAVLCLRCWAERPSL